MIVYKELATLEKELGYSAKQLYGLSNSITKHYKTVKIPKRNGKEREFIVFVLKEETECPKNATASAD